MENEEGRREAMLRVANIAPNDGAAIRRLIGYLAANQDPGVRQRPEDMVKTAVETGLALMIDEDGKPEPHACSLIYGFDSDRAYSEIGTQRVTLNRRGLQVFLASFHLVQLRFELDAFPATTFAVVSPSTPSEHNLVDVVGMDDWEPPRQVVEARAAAGVPFIDGKRVIAADDAAVAKAFAAMRGWHVGDNVFRSPKGDVPIRIDSGWFDPSVLKIG